jgi:hypothetical protein
MGTLLDLASLVTIPSGYKVGTVYSVVPTDGAGDLTFTRSNDTATRVGPTGLIEKVRTNLALQSQTFNNSPWTPNAAPTITANTTVAPDGTTTADTIASTASNSGVYQIPTVAIGVEYSVSIYIKNISSATNINIGCDLNPGTAVINFNAVTGLITSFGGSITSPLVTNVGNGWYRVSGTYVATGTANTFIIFGQSGMTFAVWGAQLESGVTTDYIPTTTTAVSVGPVANLPRLDYLNSTCPNLLLEPQRTNLVTNSEIFNNWQDAGGTVTSNTAISPSGYQDADTLTGARFQSSFATNIYTFSCYAKKVNGDNKFVLRLDVPGSAFSQFDLNTGVIDATTAGYTSTITNVGNGWYRCTITSNSSITINNAVIISASGATNSTYIWGAQLEVGSYATSYVPTLGSARTRGADACSKTGISSLIGQTEGVIYLDFIASAQNADGQSYSVITIFGNTSENFQIYTTGTTLRWYAFKTSVVLDQTANETLVAGQRYKIAYAYKSGDWALYINGVQKRTNTSTSIPAVSQFNLCSDGFGATPANVKNELSEAILFPTRLSNAELAQLTTL